MLFLAYSTPCSRFLKARKFDLDKTVEMFSNHLKWREEFGTDEIHLVRNLSPTSSQRIPLLLYQAVLPLRHHGCTVSPDDSHVYFHPSIKGTKSLLLPFCLPLCSCDITSSLPAYPPSLLPPV